jgi:hypothetical protein
MLHQRTIRIEIIAEETNSLYGTKKKHKFSHSVYTGWSCSFFTSALMVKSRSERCPSWVGWSGGLSETYGQIPCISCMWCLVRSARPSLQSNIFCGLLHMHVGLILVFQQTLCQVTFMLLRQCSIECIFIFENVSEIETVSSASEFLRNTLNLWDKDSALVYCIWRKMIASWWLHYGVNVFFGGIR